MKDLNFNFKLNEVDKNKINFNKLDNNKINIINVDYNFESSFEKISDHSNEYIEKCFLIALQLLKRNQILIG